MQVEDICITSCNENKMMKNIGWSIGNYCNAGCKHCYSWKVRKSAEDILTKEEIDIIVDKLIAAKVETVNFGGNEPIFTQGPDVKQTMLPYIITRLTEAGIICGITTNGYTARYMHENHHDAFMMVNDWDFSLDSPFEEEHNKNRGVKNSFEGIKEGLRLCTEHDRPKSIVAAGMNWNMDEKHLAAFLELAKEFQTEFRINTLKPIEPHHFDLLPSVEQVYESFAYLIENTKLVTLGEPVLAGQAGIECHGCSCGVNSMRIRSKINGRVPVTPCVYMHIDGGDLLTQSFDEIINSEVFKNFNCRRENLPEKCKQLDCEIIDSCRGGCHARTLLYYNDSSLPDPYCPYTAKKEGKQLCKLPEISHSTDHKGVRVHENYLCTWIGEPKK